MGAPMQRAPIATTIWRNVEMQPTSRPIYIDKYDLERLRMLLQSQGDLSQPDKAELHALARDLEQSIATSSSHNVPHVITLNSRFRLKNLETGHVGEYTLVFPGKSNKGLGKISILTPRGAALLGAEELETVPVLTETGVQHVRVDEILFQPEAAATAQV